MNPGPRPRTLAQTIDAFWVKVEKTEGCWLWMAGRQPNGYGRLRLDGKAVYAHRFAYELLIGPIPKGLQIDHLCRVRHCVNPTHLEPVTHRENTLRGEAITAIHARKTHCPQGHPYDAGNTYREPLRPWGRACRECKRIRVREYRAKQANLFWRSSP